MNYVEFYNNLYGTKLKFEQLQYSDNLMTTNYHYDEQVNSILKNDLTRYKCEKNKDKFYEKFCNLMKNSFYLNIKKWEPNKISYPEYIFLGTDKGILSYLTFCYHSSDNRKENFCNDVYYDLKYIKNLVSLCYSDLDRPLFIVHLFNYPNFNGIYFETDEMIKDNILNGRFSYKNINGHELYIPKISEFGNFDELINILQTLKVNKM